MAYNILNGTVEFSNDTSGSIESMVNTWQAQTINGNKVFVQTLSASSFRSNAGVIVPPAITAITNDGANRVITSDGDGTATAHANVTIVGTALTASLFSGSGVGLTNIRSTELNGAIQGAQINKGDGLTGTTTIGVQAYHGITVGSETGVSVDLMSSHGLVFSGSSNELAIDPSNPAAVTAGGQSLSDDDSFIIYDLSRTQTRKATADNIFSYINGKLSAPSITSYTNPGDNRIVTSVNNNTVNAEANLTFDGSNLKLNGLGQITGSLELTGSGQSLIRLHARDADNLKEIAFLKDGNPAAAIQINDAEHLFIENENQKDIILRANNQNALRVIGSQRRVIVGTVSKTTANAQLDVEGNAIISGSFTVSGSSTVGLSPAHIAQFDGQLSASAGVHVTGSDPHIAIGARRGTASNPIMLNVKPHDGDGNNKILCLFQRTEGSGQRTVLAATGSGQVAVGGSHLAGVFNISGSTAETLISAKSDTANTAFTVRGNGDTSVSGSLTVSGSVRGKQLHITTHKWTPGGGGRVYLRFNVTGSDGAAGDNNKMIAPYNGKLIKVMVRNTQAAGSTAVALHTAGSETQNVGTGVEAITRNMAGANVTYTFTFTSAASYTAGEIVGLSVAPGDNPGSVVATAVWEFDENSAG